MSYNNEILGSKWHKFDFHTHTPASFDYKDKNISADRWLEHAMREKLDCVAITDHNSGRWIDKLKTQNQQLKNSPKKPDWYRDLTIFPGAEITVIESTRVVHLLALFDPEFDSQSITSVLGACGITEKFGQADTSTSESILGIMKKIREQEGVVIPAHIDGNNGLLERQKTLNNGIIKKCLESAHGAEFCDINYPSTIKDSELRKALRKLAKVGGSDAHELNKIGRYYSWVKMSKPTIDSLKQALSDHELSIINTSSNPNIFPEVYVTKLTINNMGHCGRIPSESFEITLNPKFNSIIGGRGTGKSTIIESIRIASRQDKNLELEAPLTKNELEKFMGVSKKSGVGVMLRETEILLQRKRNGKDYQIRWRQDGEGVPLESQSEGQWKEFNVGELNERFPITIFSQKQINELATNTQGLLGIIDRTPEVDKISWDYEWDKTKSLFLQLREQKRELNKALANEENLEAKLEDVEYDLKHYEEKGHGEVLKEYQKRNRQKNGLAIDHHLDSFENKIRELAEQFEISDFPEHLFDEKDETAEEMKDIHLETTRRINEVIKSLFKSAQKVNEIRNQRSEKIKKSQFYSLLKKCGKDYEILIKEYKNRESSISISLYGEWVNKRNELQNRLDELQLGKVEIELIDNAIIDSGKKLLSLRTELFMKRREFLEKVIGENDYVQMDIIPFGDITRLDNDFRGLLNFDEGIFSSSILDVESKSGILYELHSWEENNTPKEKILELVDKIKSKIRTIAKGSEETEEKRFCNRLKKFFESQPAIFDNFDCWFPEDLLRVKYSSNQFSSKFENLEKGSAGQKAAAILAFLLSHGNEPLVIDQPEDDLDNALISDLIVNGIHKSKNKRQLIIATHNPNIVVNGDSELVSVLKFSKGQVKIDKQGGLDDPNIRDAICNIMEGGREAFEKRYKRITMKV